MVFSGCVLGIVLGARRFGLIRAAMGGDDGGELREPFLRVAEIWHDRIEVAAAKRDLVISEDHQRGSGKIAAKCDEHERGWLREAVEENGVITSAGEGVAQWSGIARAGGHRVANVLQHADAEAGVLADKQESPGSHGSLLATAEARGDGMNIPQSQQNEPFEAADARCRPLRSKVVVDSSPPNTRACPGIADVSDFKRMQISFAFSLSYCVKHSLQMDSKVPSLYTRCRN